MTALYRIVGYFGLASIFGALAYGFRYDPKAPYSNYLLDILMFLGWVAVHLSMTSQTFKRALYGARTGTMIERQVYILVTVTTWLALLWFHLPVPGFHLILPDPVRFAAYVGFVLSIFAFFEGVTFPAIDSLLGVPGSALSHSHGGETPLLTEGQYASVRHPMYRAAIVGGLCTIVIHCNPAQILWSAMIAGTFIFFIPVEESRLIEARGDQYRAYMQKTEWRLMRGLW
jgi:protein-S-isoprenylcysteine O-methyltransferase Ste14